MYSTEGISGNQESSYNGFEAGINKVKFKDFIFVSAKKDGTGDKVMTFTFINDKGNEMDLKMFPLSDKGYELLMSNPVMYDTYIDGKGTKVSQGSTLTLAQAKSLSLYRFGSRIAEIVYALKGTDVVVSGISYADLAKNLNSVIKETKGTEVLIAVQYDYKGYLRIGKADNSQKFIAHVDGNLNKLKLKLEKPSTPTPDIEENPSTTSLDNDGWGATETKVNSDDTLPF